MGIEAFEDFQVPSVEPTGEYYGPAEADGTLYGAQPEYDVPSVAPTGESFGPLKPQVTGQGQEIYYGANGDAIGYDDGGNYKPYEYDAQPSFMDQASSLWTKFFGPTTDANGRQQQSFAASVVLGAAQSVLQSMAASKAQKAASDLANQNSSNRIKEKSEEENRIRAAASAMPAQASRGTRTVARPAGLLSQAR